MTANISSQSPETQDWVILAVLSVIWGSSFILIKFGLESFDPMQVGALRILIAGTAFLPFIVLKWKQIPWHLWKFFLLVGLCGSGIPAFLFPIAQTQLSSSVAGILNTLTPIFTLLIGAMIFGTTVTKSKVLGVAVGFVGAALLILFGSEIDLDQKLSYSLYIILATICYGLSVNVAKAKLNEVNPTLLMSTAFFLMMPFAIASYFVTNTHEAMFAVPKFPMKGLIFISILSLLGTFYSSMLFYKMVQRTNPVFGASVTYLIPIVSCIWGVVYGEIFGLVQFGGMLLILIGVYLSRK